MNNGLLENAVIEKVSADNAGTATVKVETDIVDMKGFDAIIWVVLLGNVVNGSVITLSMVEDEDSAHGDDPTETATADKLATTATANASHDDKLVVYECLRPAKRYVRLNITPTTQDAPFDGVIAIKTKARDLPITASSDVIASAQVVSPVTE
jgi:hypothetical protein